MDLPLLLLTIQLAEGTQFTGGVLLQLFGQGWVKELTSDSMGKNFLN
jgi:uncharacterized membrane protein